MFISPMLVIFLHLAATLGETLARHRRKPRVYIGCMKSGPVLAQRYPNLRILFCETDQLCLFEFCLFFDCMHTCNRGVRYHEPEFWKFGDNGNKYFRHATGQLYAISKDLASYIGVNK